MELLLICLFYGLSGLAVGFPLLGALWEARTSAVRADRIRWRCVAAAAVFMHPFLLYSALTFLSRVAVETLTSGGGTLSVSMQLLPWLFATWVSLAVASFYLLYQAAGRMQDKWDRKATRFSLAFAPIGLLLTLLAQSTAPLPSPTVGVHDGIGIRFVYSCDPSDGPTVQRIEWPAVSPLVAEEVGREWGDWLRGCPEGAVVRFVGNERVEVRDRKGLLWENYQLADYGVLPGAGGRFLYKWW